MAVNAICSVQLCDKLTTLRPALAIIVQDDKTSGGHSLQPEKNFAKAEAAWVRLGIGQHVRPQVMAAWPPHLASAAVYQSFFSARNVVLGT